MLALRLSCRPQSVRLSTPGVLRGWKKAPLRSAWLLPCLAAVLVSACALPVPQDSDPGHAAFLEWAKRDVPDPDHAEFLRRAKRD